MPFSEASTTVTAVRSIVMRYGRLMDEIHHTLGTNAVEGSRPAWAQKLELELGVPYEELVVLGERVSTVGFSDHLVRPDELQRMREGLWIHLQSRS